MSNQFVGWALLSPWAAAEPRAFLTCLRTDSRAGTLAEGGEDRRRRRKEAGAPCRNPSAIAQVILHPFTSSSPSRPLISLASLPSY